MSAVRSIPAPQGLPFVGNTLQIPAHAPNAFLEKLAAEHDEGIYQLDLLGRKVLFVSDPDLVAELCDETRFYKGVDPPLSIVRDFSGDGLFTARRDEPVWGHAHRILMPAFSQRSMKAYFPQMLEVAEALAAKWAVSDEVNVPDDMTRLTLDTISLTGFDYRFDSFDSPELHPFLQSMGRALTEAMFRNRQLPLVTKLKKRQEEAYRADILTMQDLVDDVIRQRRAAGRSDTKDLLGLMLEASDPQSGERLSDENIRNQVLTFLIAGHETTSGLLSFALYNLLRNPHVLARAYAEVDRMLPGDTVPTYETIMKLDVIPRILEETLRIWSPIPAFSVKAFADTTVGGYPVREGQTAVVLLPPLHRHPKAWDRPEEFDIDRWLPENRADHHPAAYKPFGNGERACIGRQFALTEARLALAVVLQRFAISDPEAYRMQIKQTLTLKPDGFTLRVRERKPYERGAAETVETVEEQPVEVAVAGVGLTVAYGSNLGTSADVAERLAERAGRSGFATTLTTLDELDPPEDGLLVVVTSTYNGKAPDNAQRFDALDDLPAMDGVRLALLGCGNTQWPTYQDFPRRAFDKLVRAGAVPLIDRGEADADGDFDGDVSAWTAALWAALAAEYGTAAAESGSRYEMEVLTEADVRPAVVSPQAFPLTVLSNDELTGDPAGLWDFSLEAPRPGVRSIVAELPAGTTYTAGDHLAVFAKNDPELVEWALHCLRLPREQVVRLRARGTTHLPVDTPVTAGLLLTEFAELQEVATRSDLAVLAGQTECPWTRGRLAELETAYADEILAKRVSVLTLLERFPAITLPLPIFLEMTGPIRPRYYSISSSPLAGPGRVRITVGLVEGAAWSGSGEYRGMCSAYLAALEPGDVFYGYVRVPSPPFRLPDDPATPVILIGPGTGFAPLRGFLEERALAGATGPAEVFYGCRHPSHDWLYRSELQAWEEAGVARVHPAFSAVAGHPFRFVQEAVAAEADTLWALLERGAHVYVCGDGLRMAPAVRRTLATIYRERTGGDGEEWLRALEAEGRYQQDVFA
ncbi:MULTISPECIES: bifunctional cytochrome P450/NADPH--P450 reductase [Streptosporangium]|uniref:Bifunctional cytochrome P450/NADPH--P450 reductase n=1 Tax=Streptosporangium brasiliense TaxID=47480 RepID=A0ABT9R317_9ACTN|nr:cytochrome P450 [Streptosporangium brasiliense]MDP9863209.1 cytochrome P450/NADPH-cytochrome P450 reductase [Streptosporangium brasiliense]